MHTSSQTEADRQEQTETITGWEFDSIQSYHITNFEGQIVNARNQIRYLAVIFIWGRVILINKKKKKRGLTNSTQAYMF